MRILVLGGTNFIGRNLIEKLQLDKSLDITIFNRGKTNQDLFPEIDRKFGNRRSDVKSLEGTDWDCVIDLTAYHPKSVSRIINSCASIKRYLLISTCSVYDPSILKTNRSEDSQLLVCTEDQLEDDSMSSYGNRKAACEHVLRDSRIPSFIFRPALVYGKYDSTDRMYYWVYRFRKSETFILPDAGMGKFSLTYVDDLVRCIVIALQSSSFGTYNIISNQEASIDQLVKFFRAGNKPISVESSVLTELSLRYWTDIPLWLPGDNFTYSNKKMKEELQFVPSDFSEGLLDIVAEGERRGWPIPSYGISPNDENDLIERITGRSTST